MTTDRAADQQQLLRQVEAAAQGGDIGHAVTLAREALAHGVESPLVLNLRAYWHEQEGRNADALADLQRAQQLAPDDVLILNALGLAHARLGNMAEAVQAFTRAIDRDPDFGPAHFNKGWASEDLGELDTAKRCFARALELRPSSADPLARLAGLAVRAGDWDAARAHAIQALAIAPDHPLAVIALAGAELAETAFTAAENRLRALLAQPNLAPNDRAQAEGLLGDVLDAEERYGEAFAAYAARNDRLQNLHRARFAGSGVETMPQYLEWLTEFYERTPAVQWGPASPQPASGERPVQHVFVLGFARSGTTLLEEVLGSNPQVATTQERDAMTDSVREFMTTPNGMARLARLSQSEMSRWRQLYWTRIEEFGIDRRARVLIDKQPFNTIKLPLIFKLFPEAKVIFTVRDPRDVVLSCFRRQFRLNPSTFEFLELAAAARFYDAVMRIGEICRAKLPLDLLQLHHEDLVVDFDGQMRSVCAFAGLPWSDAMRDFATKPKRRAIATPSASQIRGGLNRKGLGQWQRYSDQMTSILPILSPWIERFGYI